MTIFIRRGQGRWLGGQIGRSLPAGKGFFFAFLHLPLITGHSREVGASLCFYTVVW
jgi:hypothetical protein